MTNDQGLPPGWYTDPVDRARQRYWDGTGWTGQVRDDGSDATMARQPLDPAAAPAAAAPPAASPPAAAPPAASPPAAAPPAPTPPAMPPPPATAHQGAHPARPQAASLPVAADQQPATRSGPPRAVLAVLAALAGIAVVGGVIYSVDRWVLTDAPPAAEPQPAAPTDGTTEVAADEAASDETAADAEVEADDGSGAADADGTDDTLDALDPVDVDALRPEQLIAEGYTCLDLREGADLWERSTADGMVVWSYEEPDPSAIPADARWVGSRLELLATTDLTGDGRQELVINASCTSGAGGQPQVIAIYTVDGEQPRILQLLHDGVTAARYGDVMRGLQVEPGRINALRAEYDEATDSDAASVEEIEFRWNADAAVFTRSQVSARQWWARPAVLDVPVFDGLRIGPRGLPATQVIDGFVMPSGNIACVQTGDGSVSCVIRSLLDPQPASSVDCSRFDLIRLLPSSSARVGCDNDQAVPFTGLPTLEYDRRWSTTDGSIVCSSEETGLQCSNDRGHGLFLSRAVWDAW